MARMAGTRQRMGLSKLAAALESAAEADKKGILLGQIGPWVGGHGHTKAGGHSKHAGTTCKRDWQQSKQSRAGMRACQPCKHWCAGLAGARHRGRTAHEQARHGYKYPPAAANGSATVVETRGLAPSAAAAAAGRAAGKSGPEKRQGHSTTACRDVKRCGERRFMQPVCSSQTVGYG